MNRTVAMVAAASVVLAGCSSTPHPAAQPTASTVASATLAASTPWVRAGDHRWQQLPTIAGDPLPPGSGLQPGASIVQRLSDGGGEACTVGAGFTEEAWPPLIGAAGHCDHEAGRPVYSGDGAEALGVYTDTVGGQIRGLGPDITWLELAPGQELSPDAGRIAGRWPVIGVMPADEIRQLPAGTPACAMTGSAGPRCGVLGYRGDKTATIIFEGFAPVPSDSGSAVFLVTEGDQAVLLGGISVGWQPLAATSDEERPTFTYYSEAVANKTLHPALGADHGTANRT